MNDPEIERRLTRLEVQLETFIESSNALMPKLTALLEARSGDGERESRLRADVERSWEKLRGIDSTLRGMDERLTRTDSRINQAKWLLIGGWFAGGAILTAVLWAVEHWELAEKFIR